MRPPRPLSPEHALVFQAMPGALFIIRKLARCYHVRASQGILEDCEQVGCKALLESLPRYDKLRGPFNPYAWKRVAGAVIRYLNRELSIQGGGLGDALEEAGEFEDTSDPFSDEDEDALGQLKGYCRSLTFARFMGDTRSALQEKPDDALIRAHALEALGAAFGGLDEQEVRLLTLRHWEERTWKQVAEALGMSEDRAKYLYERLRERLKRDLHSHGVSEPPASGAPL